MKGQRPASPYEVEVALSTCKCPGVPQELFVTRSWGRAVAVASGYWNLITGFWGAYPRIINVSVIDRRDGTVLWRNGQSTTAGGQNAQPENPSSRTRRGFAA